MPARGRNRDPGTVWYRAEVRLHERDDEFFHPEMNRGDTVRFLEFPVIRETPCGIYIRVPHTKRRVGVPVNVDPNHHSNLKWAAKEGRKRFAYPTKKLALESLKRRKRMHQDHSERRLNIAKRQLSAALTFELEE